MSARVIGLGGDGKITPARFFFLGGGGGGDLGLDNNISATCYSAQQNECHQVVPLDMEISL